MDVAFFKLDGRVEMVNGSANAYTYHSALADDASTVDLEIICGKVLKYLLTYKGTDAFEPDYGGTALHRTTMSSTLLQEMRIELNEDIRNCVAYLKKAENLEKSPDEERLYDVKVLGISYNRKVSPDTIHIRLLIRTTQGNQAVVQADVNPKAS